MISSLGMNLSELQPIILVMIEACSDGVAEFSFAELGPPFVSIFLDAINSENRHWQLPQQWRGALIKRQHEVLGAFQRLLDPQISTITLISSILDPYNDDVLEAPLETWRKFFEACTHVFDPGEQIELTVFLFVLGLQTRGSQTAELVAHGFQSVHDFVARGSLSKHFIDRIAPAVLPHQDRRHPSQSDSIRPDDVRNALVEAWARNDWTIDQLLNCVLREETLRQVLDSSESSRHSTKLRRSIGQLLSMGTGLEEWQFDVLKQWQRKTRRWWE